MVLVFEDESVLLLLYIYIYIYGTTFPPPSPPTPYTNSGVSITHHYLFPCYCDCCYQLYYPLLFGTNIYDVFHL